MFYAAFQDGKYRRIPNSCIVAGSVLGLFYQVVTNGFLGIAIWLVSGMITFVFTIPCYLCHQLGAGDSKLSVITVAMLGMKQGGMCLVIALLIAGVWAVGIFLYWVMQDIRKTGIFFSMRNLYYQKRLCFYAGWRGQTIPLAIPMFLGYAFYMVYVMKN